MKASTLQLRNGLLSSTLSLVVAAGALLGAACAYAQTNDSPRRVQPAGQIEGPSMGEIWQATNSAAFAERELRIAAGTASSTVRVAAPAQLSGRVGRAISQTTSTPLLNLNFGWGTEKTGTAAIGQTTNDFWNWCNTWWGTPFYMTDLAWSDGSDSGASLEIDNGTGLWGSGSPDPMYDSFVYSG